MLLEPVKEVLVETCQGRETKARKELPRVGPETLPQQRSVPRNSGPGPLASLEQRKVFYIWHELACVTHTKFVTRVMGCGSAAQPTSVVSRTKSIGTPGAPRLTGSLCTGVPSSWVALPAGSLLLDVERGGGQSLPQVLPHPSSSQ